MARTPESQSLSIDGPVGHLECLLERPRDAAPLAVAVVCHPHPAHGGAMTNKVTHSLARAFVSQGCAAMRFNFRGVGKSDGSYAEGDGELEDALAVADWMTEEFAGMPLWCAGFSFGGAIAVRASLERSVAGLISVAPAVSRFAPNLDRQPECPWLIVQGDNDELVDIEEIVAFVDQLDPGPELAVFPDGEHFFHGRLVELRDTAEAFIAKHLIEE